MPPRTKKTSTKKSPASAGTKRGKRSTASRKRLPKPGALRGAAAEGIPLGVDDPEIRELVARLAPSGVTPVAAYRDPLGGRPLLLAAVPVSSIEPTPYQRELSPTHAKRLAAKIEETGWFLDPLIAVEAPGGGLWTPNGRHRLAAARALGLRSVMAIVSPDGALAWRILALNTEKAHNLRDRSLEAIRMARALATSEKGARESRFAAELESPWLVTLGILYEGAGRFAGGAWSPVLRRVDRFLDQPLEKAIRQREGWASRISEIDGEIARIVRELEAKGFRSPYLKSFVVARINPVRWIAPRKGKEAGPVMPIGEALTRMLSAARRFRADSVRERDLALVAGAAPDEPE